MFELCLPRSLTHQIQSTQRAALSEYLPSQKHTYDIRTMTTAQTTLLMAIYDLEETRTLRYRPSVLLQYFCNESINSSTLIGCLDAIAHKVRFDRLGLRGSLTADLRELSQRSVGTSRRSFSSQWSRRGSLQNPHRLYSSIPQSP